MGKAVLLFTFAFFTVALQAQRLPSNLKNYSSTEEKLKRLKTVCDSLTDLEQYAELRMVANYASQLVPSTDTANLALFNYHLGVSMEGLTHRDSAIFYHERSLRYALDAHLARRARIAYQRLLFLYHSAGNELKADDAAAELKHILDSTANKNWKYEILAALGNYYNERADYQKNIDCLLQSIRIQKELLAAGTGSDSADVGITLLNIAKAFLDLKQPEKAIGYITPSWPYLRKYVGAQTYYHKNFMDANLQLQHLPEALAHYDSLCRITRREDAGAPEWNDRIAAELALADHYLGDNKTDSAWSFIKKADEAGPQWADEYLQSQMDYMKGKLYAAQGNFAAALPLLKASEDMTRRASLEVHAGLLRTMAKAYAATGQWKEAYAYYEKFTPLRDSLYRRASEKSIAEAEARFQNREKQQQIERNNIQLSLAKRERAWLWAGLGLAALIVLLLFLIYRNKKRTADALNQKNTELASLNAQLEEANSTKARLFSIISHDLRSPISQVYQFLKLQQLNPDLLSATDRDELSKKIQAATGSLLETMEDLLLWSKTQMSSFNVDTQPVLVRNISQSCVQLLQLNADVKHVTLVNSIPVDMQVDTDPHFLQTIIRNLLQNAIKASPENADVNIECLRLENSVEIIIENPGKKFSQENFIDLLAATSSERSLDGLGLRLVAELTAKLGGTIHFTTTATGRTRAVLQLPVA